MNVNDMYDYVEFIIEFVAHLSDYSLANESKTNNNKKKSRKRKRRRKKESTTELDKKNFYTYDRFLNE